MTANPTTDSLTNNFPVATISTIATDTEEPSYTTLRIAQTQLNSNAQSIHSNGGDGNHGHLALTIAAATYTALTGIPFIPPVNPPIQPVHVAGATAPQISETNRQHLENQKIYSTYIATDKALLKQLLEAFPATYAQTLYDQELGWGNLTCLELLTYLWTTYGEITPTELEANLIAMKQPWTTEQPIDTVFDQLTQAIRFSIAGHDTITDATAVRNGYTIIEDTGLFTTACHDWRQKATADKTLNAFKTHFRAADKDRRRTTTTGAAGYHSANTITTPPTDTATALTAIQNMQTLLATPAFLTLLSQAQSNNRNTEHAFTTARQATQQTTNRTPTDNELSWCWTHGTTQNTGHNSITCQHKSNGHQDNATADNKMGGSTATCGPRNTNRRR